MMKHLIPSILCCAIVGCGGGSGDGSSSANTTSINGKAIDGYVIGATVFLDVNFSGQLDSNEPSVLTVEGGDYSLDLTGEFSGCEQYAPIVTHVPVGATDEDLGVVEQEYYMSTPPTYTPVTDEDIKNVTPLTSLIWDSIKDDYAILQNKSCIALKSNQDTYARMQEEMQNEERRIAAQYNITVDELYSDYIADGNSELQTQAEFIVRQLQAKYAHEAQMQELHPNADIIVVTVRETDIGTVSRTTEIFWSENGRDFVSRVNETLNSEDLSQVTERTHQSLQQSYVVSGLNYYTDLAWDIDHCTKSERINDEPTRMLSGTTIEITNQTGLSTDSDSYEECAHLVFTAENTTRAVYQHERSDPLKEFSSDWHYLPSGHLFDAGFFMNMSDRIGDEIIPDSFLQLPFAFVYGEDMDDNDADFYSSSIRQGESGKANTIQTWRSSGYEQLKTNNEDGTYTITCTKGELSGANEEECENLR
ncbi:hypothetical protein [Vibrio sp. B1FLJ16]|uniref:hypothetical protein n=1 Tax=Vibrio sp. B1FLJ16 TaxID=2751178 RepID=UPI0015F41922|nr:hypothetical protein [Vibrio sp. B1FLJ16]